MSEVKHTPGPWTVDGPSHNQIVWSGPDDRVCFLAHSNGRDDARDLATGRLIAAAPDLLAALEAIAFMRPAGPTPKLVNGDLIERIEKTALAALAKAKTGGAG